MVDCTMKIWSRCWKRAGLTFQIKNWRKDRWWKQNNKTLLHVLLFIQKKKTQQLGFNLLNQNARFFVMSWHTNPEHCTRICLFSSIPWWSLVSTIRTPRGLAKKKRCLKRTYDLESKSIRNQHWKKPWLFEQLWQKKNCLGLPFHIISWAIASFRNNQG